MAYKVAISKREIDDAFESAQILQGGSNQTDLTLFANSLGGSIIEMFSGIRLIGEIERVEARETYVTLTSRLNKILTYPDFLEIINRGSIQWRAIMSLYFVWTGIFSYGEESGNELWPPVFKGLGLPYEMQVSPRCGHMFMNCLREHELETFESIKEGQPYVTRILLHGLIPEKHIDRFISELIDNELRGHLGLYATGQYVIGKWCKSNELQYLPKPIQRFIKYGRPVNTSTIDRLLDMAKNWHDDDPAFWRQWGLPKYIVDAFRKHITQKKCPIKVKPGKRWTVKEKPFLHFNLDESDVPLIHIPAIRAEKKANLKISWVDFGKINNSKDARTGLIPVGGCFQSVPQDVEVGPSEDGWSIKAVYAQNQTIYEANIPVKLPMGEKQEKIPLFLFCRLTGKQIISEALEDLPQKVLLVYPKTGMIEIHGGSFSTHPDNLYGSWKGWQYVLCTLWDNGTISYSGPGVSLRKELVCELNFSSSLSSVFPVLENPKKNPVWIRSLEGFPIYTDWEEILVKVSEKILPRWRHAFGRITRLDKDVLAKPLELDFRKSGKEYHAQLSRHLKWEPGVYEIRLRGPLGMDDVILSFVYFPFLDCQLKPAENNLVQEFRITVPFETEIRPLHRTQISRQGKVVSISPKEDKGEAFCALELFPNSLNPVVILLSRSHIRWALRNETGIFDWKEWRSLPEIFYIHRIEEIADARVAIQVDYENETRKASGTKLKVNLKAQADSDRECSLMSYEAPGFSRSVQDTWIIDLKQFSDQFKALSKYESSAITVQLSGIEYPLFFLHRNPCLQDFRLEHAGFVQNSEKVRITWKPQPNDPQTHRQLRFFPALSPTQVTVHKIENRAEPPFDNLLDSAKRAELWTVQFIVDRSRFGSSKAISPESGSSFSWFRTPKGWADWLEWYDLSYPEIIKKIDQLSITDKETTKRVLPWTNFLYHFHHGKGEESFKAMIAVLGEKIICTLLPYTTGKIWEAKARKHCCLLAEVKNSSINEKNLNLLINYRPSKWCELINDIEFELSLQRYHKYLGEVGSLWHCQKNKGDTYPLMTSKTGGELELPTWLEDAIAPWEKGVLIARCDFDKIWNFSPYLPIHREISFKEIIFLEQDGHKNKLTNKDKQLPQNKSFAKFGDLFNKQTLLEQAQGSFETGDVKDRQIAESLFKRWQKWAQQPGLNRFLSRMISGRLNSSGINGLSGPAALVKRLRAHGLLTEIMQVYDEKSLSNLVQGSIELVTRLTPKKFLTDLIMSEIIISWYWNKNISSI